MWPDHAKYSDAIQNPSRCFLDAELKACAVATNRLGLPKPSSGQFAVAFELHGPRVFAVKCFTQQVRDQQARYDAIARHIKGRNLPDLVDFQFLSEGIRVDGGWYPIVKMEWAGGELLSQYVGTHVNDPAALRRLASEWRDVVDLLRRNDMAHGDLQNGNVKVVGDRIKLIDYDGMYVPALRGKPAGEIGVRHFQHPRRASQDFGPEIDNFSAVVIYLSLLAVAAEPKLWNDCFQDENLILSQADFQAPGQSPTWKRLLSSTDPDVRRLAALLEGYCRGAVAAVPSLDSALRGQPLKVLATPSPQQPAHPSAGTPWYLQGPWVDPTSANSDDDGPEEVPWYQHQDVGLPATATAAAASARSHRAPRASIASAFRHVAQLAVAMATLIAIANGTGVVSVAWPWQELAAGSQGTAGVANGDGSSQQPVVSLPVLISSTASPQLEYFYYEADAAGWDGGWYRGDGEWYGRPWVALYGQHSDYPSAWLFMHVDAVPVGSSRLYLDGLDDDWPGTNRIAVEVNGTTIFEGANPFPSWDGTPPGADAEWGQRSFSIPAGVLQTGRNAIVVTNLEPFTNFSAPPYVLLGRVVLEVHGYIP